MEMQKMGRRVVLASGRPTKGIRHLAKELELARYGGCILSFNGGMIIDCATGETLFSRLLPVESNRRIVELAMEHRVDILTYEGEETSTPRRRAASTPWRSARWRTWRSTWTLPSPNTLC